MAERVESRSERRTEGSAKVRVEISVDGTKAGGYAGAELHK